MTGRTPSPAEVVREVLDGEEACVTYGYYGASHCIDRQHAEALAQAVLDALHDAGYGVQYELTGGSDA